MIGYIVSVAEKNFIKRIINKIKIEDFENGKKYSFPKINNKLIKQLLRDNVKDIVVAKNDKSNVENVLNNNINVLDGKILFKHLIPEIIEYLSEVLETNKKDMELTILVNNYSNINLYYIKKLILTNKRINIITKNINKFRNFSEKIYEEEAIIIPVMNNKRKSLTNKKIIINIDFQEESLKTYKINREAIIINIENTVNYINKAFVGININNYKINLKNDNEEFDINEIYESYIIGKRIEEIRKDIIKNKIKISNLIGKNGKIDIGEFRRLKS